MAIALGIASGAVASRFRVAQARAYELAVIPSPAAARLSSAGHPTLVANLWWLRAVQYMGDPLADQRGWDRLYPAVDLLTDLDPGHGYAYQVAGILLGAAHRIPESNALFEKGCRNVPGRYILYFQRAVNAFLYQGDYAEAARWFDAASHVPGAPVDRMRGYAATMFAKGDEHDKALALLSESLLAAEDEDTRVRIRGQIAQVELEYRASRIEGAAEAYRERYFVAPFAIAALVMDGLLDSVPDDPFGGVLYLDGEGRVRSSVHHQRFLRPENLDGTPLVRPSKREPDRKPFP